MRRKEKAEDEDDKELFTRDTEKKGSARRILLFHHPITPP
jgi:hypothetical protein